MTKDELRKSAWQGGSVVIASEGEQVVIMRRKLPRVIELRCRSCDRTRRVSINRDGKLPRGWRKCPRGCAPPEREEELIIDFY